MIDSVPLESEGFLVVNGSSGEIVLREEMIGSGFEISGETVRFFPSKNYFNLAQFPFCGQTNGAHSTCAAGAGQNGKSSCEGPFCLEKFTTLAMQGHQNQSLYGDCTLDPGIGCPVIINYRVKLSSGEGISLKSEPTHLIYLFNTFQDSDGGDRIKALSKYSGFKTNLPAIIGAQDGSFIQIDDPDKDAKVLILSLFSAETDFNYLIGELSIDTDGDFFHLTDCFISQGCDGESVGRRISGTQTAINIALKNLKITYLKTGFLLRKMQLTLTYPTTAGLDSLDRSQDKVIVEFEFGERSDSGSFIDTLPFYSAVIGICCACCICWYVICSCTVKCFVSLLKILMRVKNSLFGTVSAMDPEQIIEKVEQTTKLVAKANASAARSSAQIAVCLSAFCPCGYELSRENSLKLQKEFDEKRNEIILRESIRKAFSPNGYASVKVYEPHPPTENVSGDKSKSALSL